MRTQTDTNKYEGQCRFCEKDFSKKEIIPHLDICPKAKLDHNIKNLRLRIIDPHMKNFWLVVEVNNQAKFKDLDNLIRKAWVECCGHLSSFGNYGYNVGKERIVMDILGIGAKIGYTYDFGSSTELTVEALKYSNLKLDGKSKIELIARNYLPAANCSKCSKTAINVCSACVDEEGMVLVCDQCTERYHNEENEEEDHYLLPLANSPRCGVCGYEPPELLDKLF